jgi:hypothetical protein
MALASQQEEILGKAYDLELVKRLWQFMIPYKRMFWLAMALLPFQQAFGLDRNFVAAVGKGFEIRSEVSFFEFQLDFFGHIKPFAIKLNEQRLN